MTQERSYSLKELRARKGVRQEDVANYVDVALSTYWTWEKDLTNARVGKVYELAEYFDVNINEIKLK